MLDIHELAAGKLAALLSRKQARDLFDCHQVLQKETLVPDRLRTTFVVYGAMNRKDWRTVSVEDVDFDPMELASQLIPTLRADKDQGRVAPAEFGRQLSHAVRQALGAVLPFTNEERRFLDLLLDQVEIVPELLTSDPALQRRIQVQPLLEWKAVNVRQHKGLS